MTVYYVDDGGSDTAPFDTWAKAATSLSALDDAVALASGDIVYIGHDHVCQYTHSGNRTITGPASNPPCVIISATQGSDSPVYQSSSTDQIDTTEGAYTLTFDGAFALHGVCMKSGANVVYAGDYNESGLFRNCTIKLGANGFVTTGSNQNSIATFEGCVFDLTADGTTERNKSVVLTNAPADAIELLNCSFVNPGYRTTIFLGTSDATYGRMFVSGCDLSGASASMATVTRGSGCANIYSNNKMPSTWTPWYLTDNGTLAFDNVFTNCSSADSPSSLYFKPWGGEVVSSSVIYRSGGASFEGGSCSWLIRTITTASISASESRPLKTPYVYGYIDTAGTKTFDLYITNDTADFTDAEVWLEVEYLGTADGAQWAMATDQRATITTTAADQTDDTTSTWVGTGPSFTYKQKLSVTATVAEEGQFRARVCVGVASIASSRYFYIDPKLTVS